MNEEDTIRLLQELKNDINQRLNQTDPILLWQRLQSRLLEKERQRLIRRLEQMEKHPAKIRLADRKDLILLLLYVRGRTGKICEPLLGMTRITKLIFLAFQELDINLLIRNPYRFVPYKLGPCAPELYADLELLCQTGIITAREIDPTGAEVINPDRQTVHRLSALNDAITITERLDATTLLFRLTARGRRLARLLIQSAARRQKNLIPGLEILKTHFAPLPLTTLLRYVYTRYPEYTIRSEIVEKILGNTAHS